ncbi:MAG: RING finger protein [Dehalococcoidia bacterium]
MNPQIQRFCPLCDRPFTEGEAVLRCEGCGVMHHPACWVKNDGCATQGEHTRAPQAQAYTSQRPLAHQAPHPGEGTRRIAREGAPAPFAAPTAQEPFEEGIVPGIAPAAPPSMTQTERIPVRRPEPARAPAAPVPGDVPEAVIGEAAAAPPPVRHRRPEPVEEFQPPRAPKRYQPPLGADGAPVRKPLPKLYGHHRLLGYWYIPAGVLVAVAIAAGIIWAGEQLFGGDGESGGAEVVIPAPSPTATPQPAAPTAVAASPSAPVSSPTARVTALPGAKFAIGQAAVVTGAGDCLNVRTKPGRENDAIVCLPDGAEVTVKGGPEEAGGLRWWRVQTPLGEGWAAEDYLVPKP